MIKLKKLITPKIEEFLNNSIKKEMDSSQIYYGMASWLNNYGYENGFKLFIKYGDEETKHAHKLMEYLDNRNCKAVVPMVTKPLQEFDSCEEIIQTSYDHEIDVENNYKELSILALKEGDPTTFHLAQYFVGEQIEEVDKFLKYANIININRDNPNLPAILEEAFEDELEG